MAPETGAQAEFLTVYFCTNGVGTLYTTRASARKAAERWAGRYRRALTFVHECALAECPRPPKPDDDGRRGRNESAAGGCPT